MNKQQRNVETLLAALKEQREIEKVIASLPRGYISVKHIAGHTYYYRQWREGKRVVSFYEPEATLPIVQSKIVVRKQNEQLLKVIKKSVRNAARSLVKAEILSEDDVEALKTGIAYDEVEIKERKSFVNQLNLGELNSRAEATKKDYIAGRKEFNRILLANWNLD